MEKNDRDFTSSGTTANTLLFLNKNVYVANVGDSRAVMYRHIENKRLDEDDEKMAIELSYDHKPTRPCEKARVKRNGGKVERLINDKKQ